MRTELTQRGAAAAADNTKTHFPSVLPEFLSGTIPLHELSLSAARLAAMKGPAPPFAEPSPWLLPRFSRFK